MNLQVDWSSPLPMKRERTAGYSVDLDKVPEVPGVYIFGRRWGDSFEALYVGQAMNIHSRVKGQLNNLRLMSHLREAKVGSRIVIPGSIITKRGQQIDKCLNIVEKSLIRYFLSEGNDLVNIQGTLLRRHEVLSTHGPRWLVPKQMFLDTAR
jgi:hypothetical protein